MANDKQVTQADKGNLPASHAKYGAIIISLSDSDKVYDDRDGSGGKSTKVVSIQVPILSCGVKIASTVYARFDPKTGDVKFSASLDKNVKIDNPESREELLTHVELGFQSWQSCAVAMQRGFDRVTGMKSPKLANQAERPRLVMRKLEAVEAALPVAAAAAAAPAATVAKAG